MELTGNAYWTADVNYVEIRCGCGRLFAARADRVKVRCPKCQQADTLFKLRVQYAHAHLN